MSNTRIPRINVPRINVSEISNFLRTTPWGKKDIVKTFEEIWKRSFPNTYTQNSVKRAIMEIDKYIMDNDLVDSFSEDMETDDVPVLAQQYSAIVDKIENDKKTELINTLNNIESLDVKSTKKAELVEKAIEKSNLDTEKIKPTAKITEIKAQIAKATLQNKEVINRHYEGSAKQTLGIQNESNALELYTKKTGRKVIENNEQIFEKKYKTARGRVFKITGKVDGFAKVDGKKQLVEVKNRVNKLFKLIPEYEKLQMNYYFALTNTISGELVEKYNTEISIHKYEFNESIYRDSLRLLSRQVDFLFDFVGDTEMLALYKTLSYDERKKYLDEQLNLLDALNRN